MIFEGNKFKTVVSASGKDDTVTVKSFYTHPAASVKLTDGDLVKLVRIPANHEITSLQLFSGDLDAVTALVFDAGTMDPTDVALDLVFVSGSTLGQAGGVLSAPVLPALYTSGPSNVDRILAIEVTTTATTAGAADAPIGCVVQYVAA
jgi:hypothetical protein